MISALIGAEYIDDLTEIGMPVRPVGADVAAPPASVPLTIVALIRVNRFDAVDSVE